MPDGPPIKKRYHPDAELAPRDVVARAIDSEMKRHGLDFVYLDLSHREADFIKRRFPNIFKRCLSFGYDLTQGPIPVVPAAHYMCGGVQTDLDGRSSIPPRPPAETFSEAQRLKRIARKASHANSFFAGWTRHPSLHAFLNLSA